MRSIIRWNQIDLIMIVYINYLITRQMRIEYLVLVLSLLAVAYSQPACLLQEPLTDDCIQSIDFAMIEQELTKYLCTISYERKLYSKAVQFCREATSIDYESGYLYLNSLLATRDYESALKVDYMLFFTNPFQHNTQLIAALAQISSLLGQQQSTNQKLPIDNNLGLPIFYFYNNQTEKSFALLKKYLNENKSDKTMVYEHFLMIRILQKQYKYYEALQYINNVIKTNTVLHPYFYHIKGNFLMHHIQFQKAIVEFEQANAEFHKMYKSNGFSFSNYNIGLCYEKLGKIDQAIKYYEKSIINLNSAEALNALGHAHYSQFEKSQNKKELEEAETYYKKSLSVDPQYTIATFNLGMLELEKNNLSKAISHFLKCESTVRSCKYGLLKAYYKSNSTASVQKILESIEKDDEITTQLAAILYEMNDYSRALDIIGSKQYKSAELYEWKGFNEYALDKFEESQRSFSRAVFLGSKKGYIYYSLGLSQFQLKKYSDCARSFDHAYRLDPRKDTKEHLQNCKKLIDADL